MKDEPKNNRHFLRMGLLALLTIAAGLPGIDGLALFRGDEKFYIHMARQMIETGNYAVPVFYEQFNLAKPPLYYWLVVLCFKTLGISLFAARLPSLITAAAISALIYWFAYTLYRNIRGATLASLAFVSSYTVYIHSKLALTDMLMTLGVLMGAGFYLRGAIHGRRRYYFFIASIGVGIAGMAKGHVGSVLAFLPLLVFTWMDRHSENRIRFRDLISPWTWLPALFLCSWWYVYLLASDQPSTDFAANHPKPEQTLSQAFIDFFMFEEIKGRPSGGLKGFKKNIGFYPIAYLRMFFPWSLCVLAGFFVGRKRLRIDFQKYRRETLMLLSMIIPIFLLFTFVILQQARSRYLLPMTPAVAILAGRFLVLGSKSDKKSKWLFLPEFLSIGIILLYNFSFIYLTPMVRGEGFENLCRFLGPKLTQTDEVWVAGMKTKYPAYAMALLAHPVQFYGVERPSTHLLEKVQSLPARPINSDSPSIYFLTTIETWRGIPDEDQNKFRLIKEGFELAHRMKAKDVLKVFKGKTMKADRPKNRFHLLLLKYEGINQTHILEPPTINIGI